MELQTIKNIKVLKENEEKSINGGFPFLIPVIIAACGAGFVGGYSDGRRDKK